MTPVVLASQSPRRQELLRRCVARFTVCPSHEEEVLTDHLSPCEAVQSLAKQKALCVAKEHPDALVIGADTAVFLGSSMLGKPRDARQAYTHLRALSGQIHQVITGVALCCRGVCETFSVTTDVEFYQLSDEEILNYIQTKEPMDKAGSYGIQGMGGLMIKEIRGDYYNVVGLPIAELFRRMQKYL